MCCGSLGPLTASRAKITVPDPHLEIRGEGGHPDPEIRGAVPRDPSRGFATDSDFKNW